MQEPGRFLHMPHWVGFWPEVQKVSGWLCQSKQDVPFLLSLLPAVCIIPPAGLSPAPSLVHSIHGGTEPCMAPEYHLSGEVSLPETDVPKPSHLHLNQ